MMYLGKIPRPGIGIRIPEIVLPEVVEASRRLAMFSTVMLSFNRETAPRDYIESRDPRFFYFGHTGTSISSYVSMARDYSGRLGAPLEVEADHVSIMGSVERALKKIAGVKVEEPIADDEAEESIRYIREELREAKEAGGVDFATIDTCDLIDFSVDKEPLGNVEARYEELFGADERRKLEERYVGTHCFLGDDRHVCLNFTRQDVLRLALKFWRSLEYASRVYNLIVTENGHAPGIEVAFDETPFESNPLEVYFYLSELLSRGVRVDFIAPNIGFKKREDYSGRLDELYEAVSTLHSIVSSMNVYLSIHSGSGSNPYTDKGFGVWATLARATRGRVKYKMSGVFIQLLLEVMADFPAGSKTRRLYEEIYDTVVDHLARTVESRGALYSSELEAMLEKYRSSRDSYNPRHDLFRHYFYVFQAVRDDKGARWLREEIVEHYFACEELRRRYSAEMQRLLERLAYTFNYAGSAFRYRAISLGGK
ncbi:tagaturonate epimerase family protein [Thermofilum adornatum]|nr:tagaturonate epimerase family protein [Thermofilum adornatum]